MRVPDHKLNDLKWKLQWDTPPYNLDKELLQDIIFELEELRELVDKYENNMFLGGDPDGE